MLLEAEFRLEIIFIALRTLAYFLGFLRVTFVGVEFLNLAY